MRILVTDGMDKTAMAQLRDMGHEVVEQFYEPEELGAALRDFDAVVVRSKTKVRKNHIDEAKGGKLRLIIRGGVGVDNIDVDYARSCGIAVRNTPDERWGAANALYLLATDIGIGTASVIWGVINDTFGFTTTICCVMACIAASLIAARVCYPRDKA